jgi:UDP-N-acetyl-D-glucosamine dehydrogenase
MSNMTNFTAIPNIPGPFPSTEDTLARRIELRTARAGVVGLGYVGLPLAVDIGSAGYNVVGIDKSDQKIGELAKRHCYIPDVDGAELQRLLDEGKMEATVDEAALSGCDVISICVPTPLRKTKDPDLSYVLEAANAVAQRLRAPALIILESTTYPGTTEEQILPLFEARGLKVGKDFHLCFSPERVDPGNERFKTRDIPKVVGGVTPECTALACAFYGSVVNQVVPVTSTRVAEMVKLLENTFRMINIGLANELAIVCEHMKVDVWEVIDAAATKPFGFMPFYPGPGLGGHCIPVDPHYLSWKTRQAGYNPRFIELASAINSDMPRYVFRRVQDALNAHGKAMNGARVHVMGVAYKKNVADVRESPALDIIHMLVESGADVAYTDPYVPRIRVRDGILESRPVEEAYSSDCAVILTDHSSIDYATLVDRASLVFDSRNATAALSNPKIFRL